MHTYHTLYEQYTEYIPLGKVIERNVLKTWIRRRLRSVECIIAPTRKVEHTLRGYGIWSDIHVIPTGIQLDKFKEHISEENLQLAGKHLEFRQRRKFCFRLAGLDLKKIRQNFCKGLRSFWKREMILYF